MVHIKEELQLTPEQVGNTIIASVAVTIFARMFIGWLCDRIGPRLAYTWLLTLGSIPVMGIGLSHNYETFLIFRLLIGAIGASFVITQCHTTFMFAPNVVGTANATSAGWGNLGGGATNMLMPLLFGLLVGGIGLSEAAGWRVAMIIAGVLCMLTGIAYFKWTQDTPDGNIIDLRKRGKIAPLGRKESGAFWKVCKDRRVWVLFLIYGSCFGIELTMTNIGAMYFAERFELTLPQAGALAGLFGLMNLFARTLGGHMGDKFGAKWGLQGRVNWLFLTLFIEGIVLMCFSQVRVLGFAIATLLFFSLFVQMAEGATFSVVPFVNKKAVGAVSGIVGAGGNMGAVLAGFMFRSEISQWPNMLLILGVIVLVCSASTFAVRFSVEAEEEAIREITLARSRG